MFSDESIVRFRAMADEGETISYKPSAWYWRDALRNSKSWAEAVELGMQLVMELEEQKRFTRSFGLIPPKVYVPPAEVRDKGWDEQAEFTFAQQPDVSAPEPDRFPVDGQS